jgi:restriction system protein
VTIPDFQSCMLPVLNLLSDGKERANSNIREAIAEQFALSEIDRQELLPSGRQRRFVNRVSWAISYLNQADLLERPRRGHCVITDDGRALLREKPDRIDIPFLVEKCPGFREFRKSARDAKSSDADDESGDASSTGATPEETLQAAYRSIRTELAAELLARVKKSPPSFFEALVVDVLRAMGYGGVGGGERLGGGADEGVDGVIREDKLGLDVIYIQAKRWDGTVGRPEIQKFVGALQGKRARKGVFMTTGAFSVDAKEYVSHIEPRVVLIDGRALADYMIDLDIGVSTRDVYRIKRVDSDYFSEDEA